MMKEQEAGKMLYRGAFSVGNPSGGKFFNPFNFTVKGIANTGVLKWGDRLLALYEVSFGTLLMQKSALISQLSRTEVQT